VSPSDLDELMISRRTVRQFTAERPERALIEELIGMAITAPSASNNQPWRFFVVDSSVQIDRMARAVEQALASIVDHLDELGRETFRSYGDYFVRFRQAPVVIVPAYRPLTVLSQLVDAELASEELERIREMERSSGLVSTALAVQNLLLAAHARGLGASCLSGPLLAADALASLVGVPDGWSIAVLVALGYAAEQPAPTARKRVASVTRWR